MNREERRHLLGRIAELSECAPDLRLGQLVANLATLALGAKVEAVWDAEDAELIAASDRLLSHYRAQRDEVA